jgi:putative transcriptional regulator
MSDLAGFGANARSVRLAAGLTQQQLADTIGMSRSSIGNIESGRYNPSLTAAVAIANALDTTVSTLLGEG